MTREQNRIKADNGPAVLSLIFDILKRQIAISTNFLTLLESEKQALIDMNMNAIIALTRHKENELAKMAQLDHSLQEVSRQAVISDNNDNDKIIKLVELIPFMSREQAVTLKKLRDQLAVLREKITDNNLINKHFASDSLGYINDAISLICNEITSEPAYHPGRQLPSGSPAPALVSREV
jgi:flagellar biosynthesis/type III secretory pathway chaperone